MTVTEKRRHRFGADGVRNDCSADAGSGFVEYGECPEQMADGRKLRDVIPRKDTPGVPKIAC